MDQPPDGGRYDGGQACLEFWRAPAVDRTARFGPDEVVVMGEHATIRRRYRYGDGPADWVRGVDPRRVRDGRIVEALGCSNPAGEVPLAAEA
ncbi:hypothetical protein P3T35_000973 [Kitasatospora sp. GP30]|uniref:nuclear transport factor 2 family protein n=1 Tax=Kitasatospora sp. GP30 TaxID=3035084 RepID=UPI000C70061F|nr:nuclear transport factor 2 family protein [Kitasatospora sp. GP30]MDH6138984.1 hypothetical protein [Kitasatospora sp. GP30]